MTLSTFAAPHQRFCAKGRSILMQTTSTPGSLLASSLNRFVSKSHTGVSSEGTVAIIRALACAACQSIVAHVGALLDFEIRRRLPGFHLAPKQSQCAILELDRSHIFPPSYCSIAMCSFNTSRGSS